MMNTLWLKQYIFVDNYFYDFMLYKLLSNPKKTVTCSITFADNSNKIYFTN